MCHPMWDLLLERGMYEDNLKLKLECIWKHSGTGREKKSAGLHAKAKATIFSLQCCFFLNLSEQNSDTEENKLPLLK